MSSKIVPFTGEFCHVTTSVRPTELGYVVERTIDTLTVQYRGGIVGKYKIGKNDFTRINVFPGEKWYSLSIDERISEVEKGLSGPFVEHIEKLDERPKQSIDEFLGTVAYDAPFGDERD
jgi:hypothetical protein